MKSTEKWKVIYGREGQYFAIFADWGDAAEYAGGLVESGWPKSEVRIESISHPA